MAIGRKTGGTQIGYRYIKVKCKHCDGRFAKTVINRHENSCWLSPERYHECLVCGKPVNSESVTCSYSCSNTHFRSGINNPNWKNPEDRAESTKYRAICFEHHERKCVICGYDRVVDVHHIDCDKKNNSPENLVPLCRNHHMEIHTNKWGKETRQLLKENLAI